MKRQCDCLSLLFFQPHCRSSEERQCGQKKKKSKEKQCGQKKAKRDNVVGKKAKKDNVGKKKKKQRETMWGERNWATTQNNETYKVAQKIRKSNHKPNKKKENGQSRSREGNVDKKMRQKAKEIQER